MKVGKLFEQIGTDIPYSIKSIILRCSNCDSIYSANRGDYFMESDDRSFCARRQDFSSRAKNLGQFPIFPLTLLGLPATMRTVRLGTDLGPVSPRMKKGVNLEMTGKPNKEITQRKM